MEVILHSSSDGSRQSEGLPGIPSRPAAGSSLRRNDEKGTFTYLLRFHQNWTGKNGRLFSMTKEGNIHVGTSGWQYSHWKGPFYPEHLSNDELLAYYSGRFHTVEINNSFYRLPKKETLRRWRQSVPADFIFSFKANRYITHMKKLKDPAEPLSRMLDVVHCLGDCLGPILFQLPPRWKFNSERLLNFLEALPRRYRYAFEFRDPSWLVPGVYKALIEAGAAFCIYEIGGRISPVQVTAGFVYIRLHGPESEAYRGRYPTKTLAGWAGALSGWSAEGKEIFCYFDNDEAGYAAQDASRLREMLKKG
jgi:uncharacterized protein YecE (DUF72 family)